jgi:MFS family permease
MTASTAAGYGFRLMSASKNNVRPAKPVRLWPLLALNFFMADMQSGIGPFVGVFLQAHGWASGLIGTAMTLGNMAGMLITTPIGGFIDATNNKRLWVIGPGVSVVLASVIVLFSQNFGAVAASQIATSVAGAAIVPAVTGITLGLVNRRASTGRTAAIRPSIMPAI